MKILGFDTSSEILDICLLTDNENHVLNRTAGLKHSELLLPGIQYILESAGVGLKDLDLIVCAKGPGSFTGLRIGVSTAKGLSAGSGIPMVTVPTLNAISYSYTSCPIPVLAVIDAKKKRFYTKLFKEGQALSDAMDASPEDILKLCEPYEKVLLAGPHGRLLLDRIEQQEQLILGPTEGNGCARTLCILGAEKFKTNGADEDGDGPIYLRKSEAEIERAKKQEK